MPRSTSYQRVQNALVSTRVTRDWLTKEVNQSEICPNRVLHGRRIRRGHARANRAGVIPDHIGNDQRLEPCGSGGKRQSAAFDARQVLPDGVDVSDTRAAVQ